MFRSKAEKAAAAEPKQKKKRVRKNGTHI